MQLSDNDFQIFGLPERCELQRSELDDRWKALQSEVHPDRFAAEGAAAQRVAMQWSVRVNEAYQRLKDPLQRSAYLCGLHGVPVQAENNTAMPAAFLMQQMEWREALDEARTQADVQAIDDCVEQVERSLLADLARCLDERQDARAGAQQVRALMFVHRFRQDIERRLDAHEH